MRHALYGTFSGAAFNCNRTDSVFDANPAQYTSFYRTQCHLSALPIRAHFDDLRYKNKNPCPAITPTLPSKASSLTLTWTQTLVTRPCFTLASTTSISLVKLLYPL